jgi:DNA polymerase (family 10)
VVNEDLARIFERMAKVLAFKGEDRFRILAYERAAGSLREVKEDLAAMAEAGRLEEIPGIGKDLSAMIAEYIRTGRIARYEQERRGIPDELIDLMSIPGLGPKTLALLHQRLRVKSLEDLKRVLDSKAVLELPGFGAKKAENLRRGIEVWAGGRARMSLGIALPLAEDLLRQALRNQFVKRADLAGSIRRGRETIGDIDLLILSPDGPRALSELSKLPMVRRVAALGDTKASVVIEGGIQVDLRAVAEESYGAGLQYFTGSKEHNVHLRKLGRERGLKINEYGVFRGERRVGGPREADVYRALDLPMIPPELRENRGEIEAAQRGELPTLIEAGDLRGDLHVHTLYSDGRATVEEMVDRAAELGYEYVALTDHSPAARIARGLEQNRLEQKMDEVARLRRKRRGRKPVILMGAEVDILADGRLDYPDEILQRLDVVVAAVHSSFRQSKDRMTGRLLDALANPRVRILAHPTNRLLGSREECEFDFERVVESAAKKRVALEINGSYLRLDLNDTMARAAQSAGALLAIGSDAHSTAQMEFVRYGVLQARRGWIEARSVVNTWPWSKLERWLRAVL